MSSRYIIKLNFSSLEQWTWNRKCFWLTRWKAHIIEHQSQRSRTRVLKAKERRKRAVEWIIEKNRVWNLFSKLFICLYYDEFFKKLNLITTLSFFFLQKKYYLLFPIANWERFGGNTRNLNKDFSILPIQHVHNQFAIFRMRAYFAQLLKFHLKFLSFSLHLSHASEIERRGGSIKSFFFLFKQHI